MNTVQGIATLLGSEEERLQWDFSREVLVVDDDPTILRLVSVMLEAAGFHVRTANDGDEAMDAILDQAPDFLITDWRMPGVDGLELCQWVRQTQRNRYIYIIIVTGRTETRHMVQGIAAGADDFFSKPIRAGELLSRMQAGQRILERERHLAFLVRHDQLTKVLTRRSLFEELERVWGLSAAEDHPLSCAMIDVDHFKSVNDRFGHLVGDSVLQKTAGVLQASCEGVQCVGRYGGEEFCVLLPGLSIDEALVWADARRAAIAEMPFPAGDGFVSITASFGVAQRVSPVDSPSRMIDRADQALLRAKQSGRNRAVRSDALLLDGPSAAGAEVVQPPPGGPR